MIGVDSNLLVRLAVRDDERQYERAKDLFSTSVSQQNPAYINLIVLVEFAWTLRRAYKYSNAEVLAAILKLVNSTNAQVQRRDAVSSALVLCQRTAIEFSDALIAIINREDGCSSTYTFDEKFVQSGLAQDVP